jgi:hypothetical protein
VPIIDIELVCQSEAAFKAVSANALADALGNALGSAAGRTWVRLRFLDRQAYAENQVSVAALSVGDLPVFVTVLAAHPPAMPALRDEVLKITEVVAMCVGRSARRVHVQYAPPAAGRQAFGGTLVE